MSKHTISTISIPDGYEDELLIDVCRLLLNDKLCSASRIQRKFDIGYARSARIVDTLKEMGLVNQQVGVKPRTVNQERIKEFLASQREFSNDSSSHHQKYNTRKYLKKVFFLLVGLCLVLIIFTVSMLIHDEKPTLEAPANSETRTTNHQVTCERSQPWVLAPEFERARSLRKQRIESYTGQEMDYSFYNCINIKYADLSLQGAEGLFYFDENSSLDELTILVDRSYEAKDDLLTAILLHHELTHVKQFVDELRNGTKISCFDAEIEAFAQEVNFLRTLNEEELMSLAQRILHYREGGYANSATEGVFANMDYLLGINNKSRDYCNSQFPQGGVENQNCYFDTQKTLIADMVTTSPFYQEQCKGW